MSNQSQTQPEFADIVYRRAALDDTDSISCLSLDENFAESDMEFIEERISRGVFVVACIADRVIAYRYGMRFCGDVFGGENFLVHHDFRGHGIGTKLSEYMFDELRKEGYKLAITGNSDLYTPAKGAIVDGTWIRPTELYKRLGYEVVAETDKTRLFLIRL